MALDVDGVDGAMSEVIASGDKDEAALKSYRSMPQPAGAPANARRSPSVIGDAWVTMETKLRLMANESTPAMEINVARLTGTAGPHDRLVDRA